jgi:hypothetical protein
LPEITADFVDAGVCLDGLCSRLMVPLKWVGERQFREAIEAAFAEVLQSYDQSIPPTDQFRDRVDALLDSGRVDFGVLPSPLQRQAIEYLTSHPSARDVLVETNPTIRSALEAGSEEAAAYLARNAEVVRDRFSLRSSGRHLLNVYRRVFASPRGEQISAPATAENILADFLSLARFHPIRTEK